MTPFLLLLMVALSAILALVAEGGVVMSAREAAMTEAEQAARAGAAVLGAATLRAGGISTGGPSAIRAAQYVMTKDGHPGTAVAGHDSVTASVATFRVPTPLLALVGIRSIPVSAQATATAVAG